MFKLFILILSIAIIGCGTENPICTENYCVTGRIFKKDQLKDGQEFSEMPANISEQQLLTLFSQNPNDSIQHLDSDPDDVFYINGVIDWKSDENTAVVMGIRIRNTDFTFTDFDDLDIWVTSWDNPSLLKDINVLPSVF